MWRCFFLLPSTLAILDADRRYDASRSMFIHSLAVILIDYTRTHFACTSSTSSLFAQLMIARRDLEQWWSIAKGHQEKFKFLLQFGQPDKNEDPSDEWTLNVKGKFWVLFLLYWRKKLKKVVDKKRREEREWVRWWIRTSSIMAPMGSWIMNELKNRLSHSLTKKNVIHFDDFILEQTTLRICILAIHH